MNAWTELLTLAGRQVSEWGRPLSDRKMETVTVRSWLKVSVADDGR